MSSSMFGGKLGAVGDISATLKTVGAKVGAAPRATPCGKSPPVRALTCLPHRRPFLSSWATRCTRRRALSKRTWRRPLRCAARSRLRSLSSKSGRLRCPLEIFGESRAPCSCPVSCSLFLLQGGGGWRQERVCGAGGACKKCLRDVGTRPTLVSATRRARLAYGGALGRARVGRHTLAHVRCEYMQGIRRR